MCGLVFVFSFLLLLELYIPPGFKLQYIHSQLNLKSMGVMNKVHGGMNKIHVGMNKMIKIHRG